MPTVSGYAAIVPIIAFGTLTAASWAAEQVSDRRPLTVSDCVNVRYIAPYEPMKINPQGTRVAYLVRQPNLEKNENDYAVFVSDLKGTSPRPEHPVLVRKEVSHLFWLADGENLTALTDDGDGGSSIREINVVTGQDKVLFTASNSILNYTVDRNGTTIAYGVADQVVGKRNQELHTAAQNAGGYRITYGQAALESSQALTYSLYIVRQEPGDKWSPPQRVTVVDPFARESRKSVLWRFSVISLSPDGRKIAFVYQTAQNFPDMFKNSLTGKTVIPTGIGGAGGLLLIKDLETNKTLSTDIFGASSAPVWIKDSQSFVVTSPSPINSEWEQRDAREQRLASGDANVFWIDANSGQVQEVFAHAVDDSEAALSVSSTEVAVHVAGAQVALFRRQQTGWVEVDRWTIPLKQYYAYSPLASDGKIIIGAYQTPAVPPDLFIFDPAQSEVRIVTKLNPELDSVSEAKIEDTEWTTSKGEVVHGLLLKPVDYRAGTRYPLVLDTKGSNGSFLCDSGPNHDPSFIPQPIANAGMMYLLPTVPEAIRRNKQSVSDAVYPAPGGLGEVLHYMDVWDSAVEALDRRGLIDPAKVGIIGFSRTGWQVEYDLAHAKTHYAAATATDNVQYSYGEYWLSDGEQADGYDQMYGGPPYGATLKNWLQYSVSFNLDKIKTPLLMEEMGYGARDDVLGSIPLILAPAFEVFVGLKRLNVPVEMYYYPDEVHQPIHPRARVASLERNLDWYRFWLQGYERPNPEDPDQYARWWHLLELHEGDINSKQRK